MNGRFISTQRPLAVGSAVLDSVVVYLATASGVVDSMVVVDFM